ncbi:TPA: hypothetical protein ACJ2W2_000857 [Enterobacter cloacae]
MSIITREQAKDLRNAFQCWQQDYDPVEDKEQYDMFGLGMVAMDALLASLETDSVAYVMADDLKDSSIISTPAYRDLGEAMERTVGDVVALYTAPPAPVSVPDDEQCKPHPAMAVKGELGFLDHFDRIISERDEDIDIGQLGCSNYEALMLAALDAFRAAMLHGAEPVTTGYKLPFDKWLSQQYEPVDVDCGCVTTEAFNHWLRVAYEAGNSPVIPDEVLSAVRKVACIREDFDDFDGDRRGIGDCLDEAEQELIVTINKYASVIAAAQQQEV